MPGGMGCGDDTEGGHPPSVQRRPPPGHTQYNSSARPTQQPGTPKPNVAAQPRSPTQQPGAPYATAWHTQPSATA